MRQNKFHTIFVMLVGVAIITTLIPMASVADESRVHTSMAPISLADIVRQGNLRAPNLKSSSALVIDEGEGVTLYQQNIDEQRPIASVTKLMTAMVTLDAGLPLDERIRITREDRDRLRGSASRLAFGTVLTRHDVLRSALAASDNRAAAALARTYPGGANAMLHAMNDKARQLGMKSTRYMDASGLDSGNVSTARDLALLVSAAGKHPLIKSMTTSGKFSITNQSTGRPITLTNSNRLVRSSAWDIRLSKTGYTSDAGNCLVMKTVIGSRPVTIVLLNSWGKLSKYGDSQRIREWLIKVERKARKYSRASA